MSRFRYRIEEASAKVIFGGILDTIVEWISENLTPEDVFTDSQLEEWAEDNGFTRIN